MAPWWASRPSASACSRASTAWSPWLAAAAWLPALLSKEMAVTVPAVALILAFEPAERERMVAALGRHDGGGQEQDEEQDGKKAGFHERLRGGEPS